MSEFPNVATLLRLLEHMPGVAFCTRMDSATGRFTWVYVNHQMAELYRVDDAELRADFQAVMQRTHPEDAPRVGAQIADVISKGGGPTTITCRVTRGDGEVRWIETQMQVERESCDSLLWYGLSTDVTEHKALATALAASERERERDAALHRQIINTLPVGVIVMAPTAEVLLANPEAGRMGGATDGGAVANDGKELAGIYKADGVTLLPIEDAGGPRASHGEASEEEVVFRGPHLDGPLRARGVWTPLRDADGHVYAGLGVFQDITRQRALEDELRARNEALAASEELKAELIERLRFSIDELSNPIIEVWDFVLVVPVIGVVDARRTNDLAQRLLAEIVRTHAAIIILDLTGVEVVDTSTADHLLRLVRKIEVVGARCLLTGIRSAVAETMVDLGVDFRGMTLRRTLKHGLREAIRARAPEGARP